MSKPHVIVLGAMGRMGQMVLEACSSANLKVAGAVESSQSKELGNTVRAGEQEVVLTDNVNSLNAENQVWIDFSHPDSTLQNLAVAVEKKAKVVIGTTGFSEDQKKQIEVFSNSIPIVLSPNMSVGVNILFKVTELVSRALGEDFDIEITEAHHHHKKDAPSGTAIGLAEAVGRGRQIDYQKKAVYGRSGMVGERKKGEVGIHALRGGSIVGDHTVMFAGEAERLELRHLAQDRKIFAQGAVRAAQFLSDKAPGLYSMFDVLGLENL